MARFLALFMGVWLSLVQSDAGLFHACSTGNAAVAAADAALAKSASRSASHAPDPHAGHAAHHVAPAPDSPVAYVGDSAPAQHDHGSGDSECHCIGHCCGTTVPALRAPDTFALVNVVHLAAVQPGRASHAVVAEWADYVLPFATAPPAVIAG